MVQTKKKPLSSDVLRHRHIHAHWQAANYLSVGQIHLFDNLLLISHGTLKMPQETFARA